MIELDPDAPSRGKVKLSQGDFRGEERLASHLWQLIRAGAAKTVAGARDSRQGHLQELLQCRMRMQDTEPARGRVVAAAPVAADGSSKRCSQKHHSVLRLD